MTAEPIGEVAWSPDPMKQMRAAYTVEELFDLPDEAPRVELTDGVLTETPSPSIGHQKINSRLVAWLERHLPGGYEPLLAVGVLLDGNTTREPDALIARRPLDDAHHFLLPHQVVVAIEIVSPGTKLRDRFEKPALAHHRYTVVGGRTELSRRLAIVE